MHMPKQTRLGYINWDGEEEELILTERLRDKPLDSWLPEDMREEAEASKRRALQVRRHVDQMEWIAYVCTPLWKLYPGAPTGKIIKLLPEPDRTIAEKIVHNPIPKEALPLERTHREPWHERIEKAIFTPPRKRDGSFSLDDILAAAGIDEADRPYASAYASAILDVKTHYPANVTLPWFPQTVSQQTDTVQ
jgi:hypothetical protein